MKSRGLHKAFIKRYNLSYWKEIVSTYPTPHKAFDKKRITFIGRILWQHIPHCTRPSSKLESHLLGVDCGCIFLTHHTAIRQEGNPFPYNRHVDTYVCDKTLYFLFYIISAHLPYQFHGKTNKGA